MEKGSFAPRALSFSTRLYAGLLLVYPAEFRKAYGGPMLQVFRDCCRMALGEGGLPGFLVLWVRTILDTVQTALEEYSQRGVDMSREKFIKLSGWALGLGGAILILGMLASSRPETYNPYSPSSWAIDPFIYSASLYLYMAGLLLLSVGYAGMFLRYGARVGRMGQFWLGLGVVSGVIAIIGVVGLSFSDSGPWWSFFFLGMVTQFLSLGMFGLVNLGQQALPRWNVLPALTGLWMPLAIVISLIAERVNGRFTEMPFALLLLVMGLTIAGLFGLGYLLQSDSGMAGRPAAT